MKGIHPIQELALKQKVWEKAEWIPQCTLLMEGIVSNPKEFCGAFWKDREQWYHGPVKTDLAFLEKIREQIEIFPEFYERLSNIEANQAEMLSQLAVFNEHWTKRQEMHDLQMSILQKFDLLLAKEKGK